MAIDFTVTGEARLDTSRAERDLAKFARKAEKTKIKLGSIDHRKFTQPLGKITGAVAEFQKSLDASNARVIAFTASAGILYGVVTAFKEMAKATIEVEHTLANINVIMGVSSNSLKKFGGALFDVGKNTGQTFYQVGEAAQEFARQGLSMEKTLKRTRDALILMRLSGMDAESSVNALTAAINSFNRTAITSTEIINKMANVDAAFAVSTKDLSEALRRVASTAEGANVSFDELIAVVTSAQQVTARGGNIIGNSLKTIFTRIQRTEVIAQMEALGVTVRKLNGEMRPAMHILKDFSKAYDGLSASTKSQTAELVGGVYQMNILKAILGDLRKEYSIYDQALKTSLESTDEAIRRNEQLNKTLSALLNESIQNLTKFGAEIGGMTFEPAFRKVLEGFNKLQEKTSAFGNVASLFGFDEKEANDFGGRVAKGVMKSIGNFLSGPGLIALTAIAGKLFYGFVTFLAKSTKDMMGLNKGAQQQAAIQQQIHGILTQNPALIKKIESGETSRLNVERTILIALKDEILLREKLVTLSRQMSPGVMGGGIGAKIDKSSGTTTLVRKAEGHIPNFSKKGSGMKEYIGALQAGYKPGRIRSMHMPGEGRVTYNDAERVKKFPGIKQPAIIPPGKAGKRYGKAFKSTWGFSPDMSGPSAQGFLPNFVNILTSLRLGAHMRQGKQGGSGKLKITGAELAKNLGPEMGAIVGYAIPPSEMVTIHTMGQVKPLSKAEKAGFATTGSEGGSRGRAAAKRGGQAEAKFAGRAGMFGMGQFQGRTMTARNMDPSKLKMPYDAGQRAGGRNFPLESKPSFRKRYVAQIFKKTLYENNSSSLRHLKRRLQAKATGGDKVAAKHLDTLQKRIGIETQNRGNEISQWTMGAQGPAIGSLSQMNSTMGFDTRNAMAARKEGLFNYAGFIPNFIPPIAPGIGSATYSSPHGQQAKKLKSKSYRNYTAQQAAVIVPDRGVRTPNQKFSATVAEVFGTGGDRKLWDAKGIKRINMRGFQVGRLPKNEGREPGFMQLVDKYFTPALKKIGQSFSKDKDLKKKGGTFSQYFDRSAGPQVMGRIFEAVLQFVGSNIQAVARATGKETWDFENIQNELANLYDIAPGTDTDAKPGIEGNTPASMIKKVIKKRGIKPAAGGFIPQFSPIESALKTENALGGKGTLDWDRQVGLYVRDGSKQKNFGDVKRDHPEGISSAIKNSKSLQKVMASGGFIPNFAEGGDKEREAAGLSGGGVSGMEMGINIMAMGMMAMGFMDLTSRMKELGAESEGLTARWNELEVEAKELADAERQATKDINKSAAKDTPEEAGKRQQAKDLGKTDMAGVKADEKVLQKARLQAENEIKNNKKKYKNKTARDKVHRRKLEQAAQEEFNLRKKKAKALTLEIRDSKKERVRNAKEGKLDDASLKEKRKLLDTIKAEKTAHDKNVKSLARETKAHNKAAMGAGVGAGAGGGMAGTAGVKKAGLGGRIGNIGQGAAMGALMAMPMLGGVARGMGMEDSTAAALESGMGIMAMGAMSGNPIIMATAAIAGIGKAWFDIQKASMSNVKAYTKELEKQKEELTKFKNATQSYFQAHEQYIQGLESADISPEQLDKRQDAFFEAMRDIPMEHQAAVAAAASSGDRLKETFSDIEKKMARAAESMQIAVDLAQGFDNVNTILNNVWDMLLGGANKDQGQMAGFGAYGTTKGKLAAQILMKGITREALKDIELEMIDEPAERDAIKKDFINRVAPFNEDRTARRTMGNRARGLYEWFNERGMDPTLNKEAVRASSGSGPDMMAMTQYIRSEIDALHERAKTSIEIAALTKKQKDIQEKFMSAMKSATDALNEVHRNMGTITDIAKTRIEGFTDRRGMQDVGIRKLATEQMTAGHRLMDPFLTTSEKQGQKAYAKDQGRVNKMLGQQEKLIRETQKRFVSSIEKHMSEANKTVISTQLKLAKEGKDTTIKQQTNATKARERQIKFGQITAQLLNEIARDPDKLTPDVINRLGTDLAALQISKTEIDTITNEMKLIRVGAVEKLSKILLENQMQKDLLHLQNQNQLTLIRQQQELKFGGGAGGYLQGDRLAPSEKVLEGRALVEIMERRMGGGDGGFTYNRSTQFDISKGRQDFKVLDKLVSTFGASVRGPEFQGLIASAAQGLNMEMKAVLANLKDAALLGVPQGSDQATQVAEKFDKLTAQTDEKALTQIAAKLKLQNLGEYAAQTAFNTALLADFMADQSSVIEGANKSAFATAMKNAGVDTLAKDINDGVAGGHEMINNTLNELISAFTIAFKIEAEMEALRKEEKNRREGQREKTEVTPLEARAESGRTAARNTRQNMREAVLRAMGEDFTMAHVRTRQIDMDRTPQTLDIGATQLATQLVEDIFRSDRKVEESYRMLKDLAMGKVPMNLDPVVYKLLSDLQAPASGYPAISGGEQIFGGAHDVRGTAFEGLSKTLGRFMWMVGSPGGIAGAGQARHPGPGAFPANAARRDQGVGGVRAGELAANWAEFKQAMPELRLKEKDAERAKSLRLMGAWSKMAKAEQAAIDRLNISLGSARLNATETTAAQADLTAHTKAYHEAIEELHKYKNLVQSLGVIIEQVYGKQTAGITLQIGDQEDFIKVLEAQVKSSTNLQTRLAGESPPRPLPPAGGLAVGPNQLQNDQDALRRAKFHLDELKDHQKELDAWRAKALLNEQTYITRQRATRLAAARRAAAPGALPVPTAVPPYRAAIPQFTATTTGQGFLWGAGREGARPQGPGGAIPSLAKRIDVLLKELGPKYDEITTTAKRKGMAGSQKGREEILSRWTPGKLRGTPAQHGLLPGPVSAGPGMAWNWGTSEGAREIDNIMTGGHDLTKKYAPSQFVGMGGSGTPGRRAVKDLVPEERRRLAVLMGEALAWDKLMPLLQEDILGMKAREKVLKAMNAINTKGSVLDPDQALRALNVLKGFNINKLSEDLVKAQGEYRIAEFSGIATTTELVQLKKKEIDLMKRQALAKGGFRDNPLHLINSPGPAEVDYMDPWNIQGSGVLQQIGGLPQGMKEAHDNAIKDGRKKDAEAIMALSRMLEAGQVNFFKRLQGSLEDIAIRSLELRYQPATRGNRAEQDKLNQQRFKTEIELLQFGGIKENFKLKAAREAAKRGMSPRELKKLQKGRGGVTKRFNSAVAEKLGIPEDEVSQWILDHKEKLKVKGLGRFYEQPGAIVEGGRGGTRWGKSPVAGQGQGRLTGSLQTNYRSFSTLSDDEKAKLDPQEKKFLQIFEKYRKDSVTSFLNDIENMELDLLAMVWNPASTIASTIEARYKLNSMRIRKFEFDFGRITDDLKASDRITDPKMRATALEERFRIFNEMLVVMADETVNTLYQINKKIMRLEMIPMADPEGLKEARTQGAGAAFKNWETNRGRGSWFERRFRGTDIDAATGAPEFNMPGGKNEGPAAGLGFWNTIEMIFMSAEDRAKQIAAIVEASPDMKALSDYIDSLPKGSRGMVDTQDPKTTLKKSIEELDAAFKKWIKTKKDNLDTTIDTLARGVLMEKLDPTKFEVDRLGTRGALQDSLFQKFYSQQGEGFSQEYLKMSIQDIGAVLKSGTDEEKKIFGEFSALLGRQMDEKLNELDAQNKKLAREIIRLQAEPPTREALSALPDLINKKIESDLERLMFGTTITREASLWEQFKLRVLGLSTDLTVGRTQGMAPQGFFPSTSRLIQAGQLPEQAWRTVFPRHARDPNSGRGILPKDFMGDLPENQKPAGSTARPGESRFKRALRQAAGFFGAKEKPKAGVFTRMSELESEYRNRVMYEPIRGMAAQEPFTRKDAAGEFEFKVPQRLQHLDRGVAIQHMITRAQAGSGGEANPETQMLINALTPILGGADKAKAFIAAQRQGKDGAQAGLQLSPKMQKLLAAGGFAGHTGTVGGGPRSVFSPGGISGPRAKMKKGTDPTIVAAEQARLDAQFKLSVEDFEKTAEKGLKQGLDTNNQLAERQLYLMKLGGAMPAAIGEQRMKVWQGKRQAFEAGIGPELRHGTGTGTLFGARERIEKDDGPLARLRVEMGEAQQFLAGLEKEKKDLGLAGIVSLELETKIDAVNYDLEAMATRMGVWRIAAKDAEALIKAYERSKIKDFITDIEDLKEAIALKTLDPSQLTREGMEDRRRLTKEKIKSRKGAHELRGKIESMGVVLDKDGNVQDYGRINPDIDSVELGELGMDVEMLKGLEAGAYKLNDTVDDIFANWEYGWAELQTDGDDALYNLANDFRTGVATAFGEAIKGTKTLEEAFSDMFMKLADMALDQVLQMTVNKFFSAVAGAGAKGAAGGRVAAGGIRAYASGGQVVGGSGNTDDVPALLKQGEYVIRQAAVKKYGVNLMDLLNSEGFGKVQKMAEGGSVSVPRRPGRLIGDPQIGDQMWIQYPDGSTRKVSDMHALRRGRGLPSYTHTDPDPGIWGKPQYKVDYWTHLAESRERGGLQMHPNEIAKIRKQWDENAFADPQEGLTSKISGGNKWADYNLRNAFVYDSDKFPTLGDSYYSIDPRLTRQALTDSDNPRNKIRQDKVQKLYGYYEDRAKDMIDWSEKVKKWKKAKRDRMKYTLIAAASMMAMGAMFPGAGGDAGWATPGSEGTQGQRFWSWASNIGGKKGNVENKASGGHIGQDNVPAMLMGGEYVISREAVKKYGTSFFGDLNKGKLPGFAAGGYVGENGERTKQGHVSTDPIIGSEGDTTNNINITVNVDSNGRVSGDVISGESQAMSPKKARALAAMIKQQVVTTIVEQKRQGGILSRSALGA